MAQRVNHPIEQGRGHHQVGSQSNARGDADRQKSHLIAGAKKANTRKAHNGQSHAKEPRFGQAVHAHKFEPQGQRQSTSQKIRPQEQGWHVCGSLDLIFNKEHHQTCRHSAGDAIEQKDDQKFSKADLETLQLEFSKDNQISIQDSNYFIFKGKIKNQAYSVQAEPIRILKKDNTVEDVVEASDQLNLKSISKEVTKYYLCYPKQLTKS